MKEFEEFPFISMVDNMIAVEMIKNPMVPNQNIWEIKDGERYKFDTKLADPSKRDINYIIDRKGMKVGRVMCRLVFGDKHIWLVDVNNNGGLHRTINKLRVLLDQ